MTALPILVLLFWQGASPEVLSHLKAGSDALNQRDGIHPTAAGARIVADNVWTVLKPIAERDQQKREGRGGS